MSLTPGCKISHYRIVERIGEGGMGIVYRAEDTRLRRPVALKILPPHLMADPDRRRRFMREARLAATLTHQNIAAVHEIDESDGTVFIAMEYVEGDSLRKLVSRGPLPADRALKIATGIAEALAQAHAAHLVHRDLKPDNVKVRADGTVKLLDFGLAKLRDERTKKALEESSQAPTQTPPLTLEGKILGTPSYMSPEQARGKEVDYRSDIFSFGTTLYEMVTGRVPFDGEGAVETLNAILHQAVEPASSVNHDVPPRLGEILDKCLQKDPADRYQHTEDLIVDLKRASTVQSIPSFPSGVRQASSPGRPRILLSMALAAVAIVAAWYWWPPAPEAPKQRIALLPAAYEGPEPGGYMSDILPMAIAEGMRTFGDLRVAPYASSRRYAPDAPAPTVGQQLGVDWVVRAKVTGKEGSFDVAIALLRVVDGASVWERHLHGDAGALIAGADGLATEVGAALGLDVPPATRASRDPKAMKLYLQGRRDLEGWDVASSYLGAEEAFRKAIALDDTFAEAHAMLAVALCTHYGETKEPSLITQAQREADRAVALGPSLPEAHAAVGLVDLRRGKSAEAAQAFAKGLRLAPADDSLHKRIAAAYERLGRDADAERMYQRAIDLRPAFWGNYAAKGIFYYNLGDYEQAAEMFRKVIELHPDGDAGYLNLAAVYIWLGRYPDAEPLLRAALRINPRSIQGWNNLGVVHYANGKFEEAAAAWREALGLGSHDVTLLTNLGEAYRQLDRRSEARSAYTQAVEEGESQLAVNPDDDEARAMVATALAGLGRCDEARVQAARAVETHSTAYVFYYVAVAYSVCGDRTEARDSVAAAIRAGILGDIQTNPDLRPLLDDPSIRALLPDAP